MLLRGLWAIVPGRSRSRCTQCTSSQSSAASASSRCAGVGVGRALGDVDVHADAEVGGQPGGRLQRVVGAGERGVHADQPAPAGAQEALVLGQPAAGAVGAVAVGHAVGAHDAHADLGAGLGDHVEAALDRVRALVVVDDRRSSRTAAPRRAPSRADGPQHVEVERGVEAPPDLLEDLAEVASASRRRRHAAGERRVQVVVGAHESGGLGTHRATVVAADRSVLPDRPDRAGIEGQKGCRSNV